MLLKIILCIIKFTNVVYIMESMHTHQVLCFAKIIGEIVHFIQHLEPTQVIARWLISGILVHTV